MTLIYESCRCTVYIIQCSILCFIQKGGRDWIGGNLLRNIIFITNINQLQHPTNKNHLKLLNFKFVGAWSVQCVRVHPLMQINPSVTNLTLSVSLPLLTYHVPSGWTVSLIDTPGFGETNEHVQQLAEDSVEVSAAYIYLLQTENIGGVEVNEMFASLAKKDPSTV